MFQLIVAVVAVVIVLLLAIATIFYGGGTFYQGDVKAKYSQYLQEGTQIQAGYKFDGATTGSTPTGSSQEQFQALVDQKYLSSIPGGGWVVQDTMLYRPLQDTTQCGKMNQLQGKYDPKDSSAPAGGCPMCSDTNYSDWSACQSADAIQGDTASTGQ